LTVWRGSFNEEDIKAVTADSRLLACIDAYGDGRLRFEQVLTRMFGDEVHHYPRDLRYDAFLALVRKVIEGSLADLRHLLP
jgi:hypothetical protein